MLLCFIVKQKLFALVLFIVCLPNIIGQIFKAHSHSNEQFLTISLVLYIVLIIGMNIAFFGHAYYTNRKRKALVRGKFKIRTIILRNENRNNITFNININ